MIKHPADELPLRIYTPESALANPRQLMKDMWADLLAGRELAWRLAVRDIYGLEFRDREKALPYI